MYDSRSSHARTPQHEAAISAMLIRRDQDQDTVEWMGRRLKGRHPALTAKEAVAEGLAEYVDAQREAAGLSIDCEGLPGLGEFRHERRYLTPDPLPFTSGYVTMAEQDEAEWREYRSLRSRAASHQRKAKIAATVDTKEGYGSGRVPLVGASAKRRAAKQPFSRTSAPAFDPALVSRTLSPAGAR
jgi:hypothetical protein